MEKDKPEITESESTHDVEDIPKMLTEEEGQIEYADKQNKEFFDEDEEQEIMEINWD